MSVLLQCFINTGRFQLGAQQRCQQLETTMANTALMPPGKHLGNSGNECRRKDTAAQAQHDNALANIEEPVTHGTTDSSDPVAGFIFAGCTACVGYAAADGTHGKEKDEGEPRAGGPFRIGQIEQGGANTCRQAASPTAEQQPGQQANGIAVLSCVVPVGVGIRMPRNMVQTNTIAAIKPMITMRYRVKREFFIG